MKGKWSCACLIAAAGLGGCATGNHLVYVHNAALGLQVAPLGDGSAKFSFGYDRETIALAPRKDENGASDAMSMTSVTSLETTGLQDIDFKHLFATGEPADEAGRDSRLEEIKERIFSHENE